MSIELKQIKNEIEYEIEIDSDDFAGNIGNANAYDEFQYLTEDYSYWMSSSHLRQIADKLDELNNLTEGRL